MMPGKNKVKNMQMTLSIRTALVVFVLSFLGTILSPGMAAAHESPEILLRALALESSVSLCDEPVPVEDPRVVERFEKEMLVALGNRAQVILWLKRSTRYFPYIEQMLEQNGLPEDIKYLAVAESALRMHAGSRKGAMGVWQLMPHTARKYELVVDRNFDERRNLYLSTPAALVYLKDLFNRFGSWSLSLAAYNMGEEGLTAEILEQGVTDYYRLYLPLETQRFIFRILAIKRIIEAPQQYGFALSHNDFYSPRLFSSERIDALADLPLRLIADASGTDFKAIKDLNPELRGHYLAAGTRMVNIPADGEKGFQARLSARIQSDDTLRSQRIYVVRKGDSLSGIALKFNVPVAALLIWNRIGLKDVIHPGQRMVVFPSATKNGNGREDTDGDANG